MRDALAPVVLKMPCLSASPRVDQCVASLGALSGVSTTTASITSFADHHNFWANGRTGH